MRPAEKILKDVQRQAVIVDVLCENAQKLRALWLEADEKAKAAGAKLFDLKAELTTSIDERR